MGRSHITLGAVKIFYPLPSLLFLVGALVMIFLGLFQKPPNGWLILPGFFLAFALVAFQIWADSSSEAIPSSQEMNNDSSVYANVAASLNPAGVVYAASARSEHGACQPVLHVAPLR